MNYEIYRIGRDSNMDIQIHHETVSRVHAELIATPQGEFYLTDCDSTGGSWSYVEQDGNWVPIKQAFISPTDVISLGQYQTTAQKLIAMADSGNRGSDKEDRPPRRNRAGEIEIIRRST